jgi:hypothetical protein
MQEFDISEYEGGITRVHDFCIDYQGWWREGDCEKFKRDFAGVRGKILDIFEHLGTIGAGNAFIKKYIQKSLAREIPTFKECSRAHVTKRDTVLTSILTHPYCQFLLSLTYNPAESNSDGSQGDSSEENNFQEDTLKEEGAQRADCTQCEICSQDVTYDYEVLMEAISDNFEYACKKNHSSVVEYLLTLDINFKVDKCVTTAVREGCFDVLKILIEDKRFDEMFSAESGLIELAVNSRHRDIARLLLQDSRILTCPKLKSIMIYSLNNIKRKDLCILDKLQTLRGKSSSRLSDALSKLIKSYDWNLDFNMVDYYFPKEYLLTKMTLLYLEECPLSFLPWDIMKLICNFSIQLGE